MHCELNIRYCYYVLRLATEDYPVKTVKFLYFHALSFKFYDICINIYLQINTGKTIRLIESTDKKLNNAELGLLFNETCKYIYIYNGLYKQRFRQIFK